MAMVPFADIRLGVSKLRTEIMQAIERVVESGQYIMGPDVRAFEQEFAAFSGAPYAVGVNSGSAALHLALLACGVGPGDEVITCAFTFAATAAAICYTGARPVLVDCDPRTRTLDPALLEAAVTGRTKAVIPVHLHGQVADMDPILAVAQRHGLSVVEDACQAHGAKYRGQPAGSFGRMGCFSFYPAKNLGALGDGGLVTCARAEDADVIRSLGNYGQRGKYNHELLGYNYRLDTLQAAVLRVKLKYLAANNAARRQVASWYAEELADVSDLVLPYAAPGNEHIYHIYAVETPKRDELLRRLQEAGIGCGMHYPAPLHLLPAFARLGYGKGAFPVAERLCNSLLSLPMFPDMTREQVREAAKVLKA